MSAPVRVLVVDDSPFVCRLLTAHLHSAPDLRVVATAHGGPVALARARELRPDAITLDVEMPGMGGLDVLEELMHNAPTPVVLISGVSWRAATVTVRALSLGAVDFVLKYRPGSDTDPDRLRQEVVAKVRLAARVKVIRSLGGRRLAPVAAAVALAPPVRGVLFPVIVVGASTGGPLALQELLAPLPADFPAAVLVVQHMPPTFTGVLAVQLDRQVALRVKEAEAGDRVTPGLVLVAPGDFHLVARSDGRVELLRGPKIGGHRPSIDVTMQSVAEVYGTRATGIVLTGMGCDGAAGLAAIRGRGGRTFAQDAATCAVNGMPQRAIERNVVDHVAPPAEIARLLRLYHA